jgi:type I restriction enzyme S subunit
MSRAPLVPLGELLTFAPDRHGVDPDGEYPIAGIYGFGRGMIQRTAVVGREMAANQLFRIRAGQFIYSRLKSFEGAYAIVPPGVDGYFVSNEFPAFDLHRERIEPDFLGWYFKQERVWRQLASGGKGIGARRERLHPNRLLDHAIPLPPITEQRQITAKLEGASVQLRELRLTANAAHLEIQAAVASAFHNVISDAPRIRMGDIAPIVRRPVELEPMGVYQELGARSFGKGLFTKPDLAGSELSWEKLFRIHCGDLVFSNIKAWEGAFAIARQEHHGKVGSHRYLTCVVDTARATPNFLWYFLQTTEGLSQIQAASPGSADRNRTLNQKKLAAIEIPTPPIAAQNWFDAIYAKGEVARAKQRDVGDELDRLIPSLMHQAFD